MFYKQTETFIKIISKLDFVDLARFMLVGGLLLTIDGESVNLRVFLVYVVRRGK